MAQRSSDALIWVAATAIVSVSLVFAFDGASSGDRTITVAVVNDADAYLALEARGDSPHIDRMAQVNGKVVLLLNASSRAAGGGSGVGEDREFAFHAVVNITNKGTGSVDVAIVIDDDTRCDAALTATPNQAMEHYAVDPSYTGLAVGGKLFLGIQVTAGATNQNYASYCTFTVVVDND